MFCDRSFARNWAYLSGELGTTIPEGDLFPLLFSTASAHYANKDYEMTITAMIWLLSFPLVLFWPILFFFLCSVQVLFTIPPSLLNYARRLLGQKRRIPLGRAELQVTNSLAYQFLCATGVLALVSCLYIKEQVKKKDAELAIMARVDSVARRSPFGG